MFRMFLQYKPHPSVISVVARLQEARLAVLMDLLRQRDEAQKHLTIERLNQIYSKNQKDKETKLRKINNDYVRCKTTPIAGLFRAYSGCF